MFKQAILQKFRCVPHQHAFCGHPNGLKFAVVPRQNHWEGLRLKRDTRSSPKLTIFSSRYEIPLHWINTKLSCSQWIARCLCKTPQPSLADKKYRAHIHTSVINLHPSSYKLFNDIWELQNRTVSYLFENVNCLETTLRKQMSADKHHSLVDRNLSS